MKKKPAPKKAAAAKKKTRPKSPTVAKVAPSSPAVDPSSPEGIAEFLEDVLQRSGRIIVGRQLLAQAIAVNPDTLSHWAAEGMPVLITGGHGKKSYYDLVECIAFRMARLGKNAKEQAQTRYFTAQAEQAELKLKKERGLLVDRDTVVRDGRAFAKGLSTKLRSLPRRMVQVGLIPRDQEPGIVALIRDVLTEISGWKTGQDAERIDE